MVAFEAGRRTSGLELCRAVMQELVNLLGLDRPARVGVLPLGLPGRRAAVGVESVLLFGLGAIAALERGEEARHGSALLLLRRTETGAGEAAVHPEGGRGCPKPSTKKGAAVGKSVVRGGTEGRRG